MEQPKMATYDKIPFTQKFVDGLNFLKRPIRLNASGEVEYIPNSKEYFVYDQAQKGLAIRVTKGSKTYFAEKRVGGRLCRYKIGTWPNLALDDLKSVKGARSKANIALGAMADGIDPNETKADLIKLRDDKKALLENTFAKVFSKYQEFIQNKSIHTQNDLRFLSNNLSTSDLFKTPFTKISTEVIQSTLGPYFEKGQISTGNKYYRYCHAAWKREAIRAKFQGFNPFEDWNKENEPPPTPRKKSSLYTETAAGKTWIQSLATLRHSGELYERAMADYVFLTLAWGTRRAEAIKIREQDVDFERKAIVFLETKNGQDHFLPITPLIEQLLQKRIADNRKSAHYNPEQAWLFPSRRHGKHLVEPRGVILEANKQSGLKVAMHDLRRSAAGDIVAGDDVLKAKMALNHSDKNDITISYITDISKLRALRPIFEKREIELFTIAGILQEFDLPKNFNPTGPADTPDFLKLIEQLKEHPELKGNVAKMMETMKLLMT